MNSTRNVTRQAITTIDRKISTLTQLRKVLIQLNAFADSYQPKPTKYLARIGSRGGQTRAAKHSKASLRRWARLGGRPRKSHLSAKGLAAIKSGQKARWRKYHKKNGKVLHMKKRA